MLSGLSVHIIVRLSGVVSKIKGRYEDTPNGFRTEELERPKRMRMVGEMPIAELGSAGRFV